MIQGFRQGVQLLFLGVFIFLMVQGKAQFWMGLIFISIALAAILGRYYCGWVCPINTLIRPVDWLARRIGNQKKGVPAGLKSEKARYIVFAVFLFLLAYTIYSITQGRKFPLPLIIIPFGLLVTFFINQRAWHRYLCPWGTFFHLTGRFSSLGFRVQADKCKSCGICHTICPSESVEIDSKVPVIKATNCLECFKCQNACPSSAISFSKGSGNPGKSESLTRKPSV